MNFRRRDLLIASGVWVALAGRALAQPSIGRRLRLKNAHTGDKFDGLYRDQTGPIPSAIADLAVLLRDHHANKIGPVHVETLDFLADVMDSVGQTGAVILSAYRTPETNAMLRATMFGVAEKSQHLLGRAVDISLEARLDDARTAALGMKRGGVGWYPRSRFIHLDTGPVRSWEMDGSGLDTILTGNIERILAGHPLRRPTTVKERLALHRALARHEFLTRRGQ
jgi:uncharacterized protein YcbK (DUF882 family)